VAAKRVREIAMSTLVDSKTAGEAVTATLNYVAPDSLINRRYVFPGDEVNTGRFVPHRVTIRNARLADRRPTLDSHGFELFRHRSAVKDFHDRAEIDAVYSQEVVDAVKRLTGADLVLPMSYLLRTSGDNATSQLQPPAADVHVDMSEASAPKTARMVFEQQAKPGQTYRRFICSSFWRTFSPPPQDWPLALCDCNSISQSEGMPNRLIFAQARPTQADMAQPVANEEELPAATIFRYTPRQRWFYFPDMNRDEVVLIKFHDSDRDRAWFAAHTAFHDETRPEAHARESIEFRTVAYWL
jgi:hypothetical protein